MKPRLCHTVHLDLTTSYRLWAVILTVSVDGRAGNSKKQSVLKQRRSPLRPRHWAFAVHSYLKKTWAHCARASYNRDLFNEIDHWMVFKSKSIYIALKRDLTSLKVEKYTSKCSSNRLFSHFSPDCLQIHLWMADMSTIPQLYISHS